MSGDRVTRRQMLRAGGVAAGIGSLPAVGAAATGAEHDDSIATVATWNLGLGADFLSIARADAGASVPERVGTLYSQVLDSRLQERMNAVAASLSEAEPDVVGVQEAALVRRGPRTGGAVDDPDAETVVVDFLASLRTALSDRGVPYRPVSVATNADVEFPGRVDSEAIDVRLTDRDALLIRADADIAVEEVTTGTYDASLTVPIDADRSFEIRRGYAAATMQTSGEVLSAVTTHLEAALADIRVAQATELASVVAGRPSPGVVLGDLNSAPSGRDDGGSAKTAMPDTNGTATPEADDSAPQDAYRVLTGDLADPVDPEDWDGTDADGAGTCCRPDSLRPPDADGLTRQIDHVLVDGLRAQRSRRLGTAAVSVDDGTEVWPSDHAGVLVELVPRSVPTATTASTTAETPTATPSAVPTTAASTTATGTPGFGVPAALAAVCAGAWAVLHRR